MSMNRRSGGRLSAGRGKMWRGARRPQRESPHAETAMRHGASARFPQRAHGLLRRRRHHLFKRDRILSKDIIGISRDTADAREDVPFGVCLPTGRSRARISDSRTGGVHQDNMPILEGIYIRAQGDRLQLVATDLEMSIECYVPAPVEREGEAVLGSKVLAPDCQEVRRR